MPLSTVESDVKQITSSSVTFDYTLVPGATYILRANTDLWYRISSAPTAAQANTDENHFLAKGQTAPIAAKGTANRVTAIRDSADGYASLSLVQGV
jgi:hypothetical protein